MFPSLHIQIADLDPLAHYCILLELSPATQSRYKYSCSGGWVPAGVEEAQNPHRIYLHPESPATGEYWMSQPVSFGRMKLTNTTTPETGHVVLSSMHKYQPRIIIAKTGDPRSIAWSPSCSVEFPETQFIAVTAYQNERITKLKIDNNPFAKGFRENGQSKSKRKRLQKEDGFEEEKRDKQSKVETQECHKIEDDRLSSCSSSSSSPEHHRESLSPVFISRNAQTCPVSCNFKSFLPRPTPVMSFYPYYYPQYSMYPPMWATASPYYYQLPPSASVRPKDLTIHSPKNNQTRKLTDFSIKAITGCS